MIRTVLHEGSKSTAFAAIKTEWQELFAATDCSPFLSWEWMSVWFDNFGEAKSPFVLKVYRDEKLIGILPMYLEEGRFVGVQFNRIAFIGDEIGGADHLDIIAKSEDKADAVLSVIDFLRTSDQYDQISFDNLPGGSLTIKLLKNFGTANHSPVPRVSESVSGTCPQIDLKHGWETTLNKCARKSEFIRKLRKLKKIDGFEYRTIVDPQETGEAFDRFLFLHEKRWQKDGGSELTGHPRLVTFQRQLVTQLSPAGLIRFDEIWIKEECVSSIYAFDDGKTLYYYNTGYDEDHSHLSVGIVLLGLSIKNAIDRGTMVYDFLRGEESYKFNWSNCSTDLVSLTLSRNTLPVIMKEKIGSGMSGLRNAAKSALPSGALQIAGNWRRAIRRKYILSER